MASSKRLCGTTSGDAGGGEGVPVMEGATAMENPGSRMKVNDLLHYL